MCQLQPAGSWTLEGAGAWTFDTDSGTLTDPVGQPVEVPFASAFTSGVRLVAVEELRIAQTVRLRVTGTLPLILAVYGGAAIDGVIDVSGDGASVPGPGSRSDCAGAATVGEDSFTLGVGGAGGGGGGYGGAGGDGGDAASASVDGGSGGASQAVASLSPLHGGCHGAAGGASSGNGELGAAGMGGGALQISSASTIQVAGSLDAGGGGGRRGMGTSNSGGGGGGGGSGGGILLEAEMLEVSGAVCANGGGGGGGGIDNDTPGSDAGCSAVPAPGGSPGGGDGGSSVAEAGNGDSSGGDQGGDGGGGGTGVIRVQLPAGGEPTGNGTFSPPVTTSL